MPTGNEYESVTFGQSEQSYKGTDREMAGGFDKPSTEPLGTPSEDNPFYYPQEVFDPIKCTGPGQSYVHTERESVSGEFGQCQPGETGPYPGDNMVPSSVSSKQFSSRPITYPASPKKNAYGNNILGPLEGAV